MENNTKGISLDLGNSVKKLNIETIPPYLLPIASLLVLALVFLASTGHSISPIFAFVTIPVLALIYAYYKKQTRSALMEKLALVIGGRYREFGAIEEMNTEYFNIGRNREISDVVSLTYKNYPADIFNFNCVVGSGKSSRSITITAAKIRHGINLPHIFLAAHCDFFSGDITDFNVPGQESMQVVRLEGDFNKYFDLYAAKEYEIETLQIFDPDTMADIIDNAKKFSLEFLDGNIYIYAQRAIENGEDMYSLYNLIDLLITKLIPELERIKITQIPV